MVASVLLSVILGVGLLSKKVQPVFHSFYQSGMNWQSGHFPGHS